MLVKTSFYLDKRYLNLEGKANLKIALRRNGEAAYIPTGAFIAPEEWDGSKVLGSGRKVSIINSVISSKKSNVERAVLELGETGAFFGKDINEVCDLVLSEIDPEYASERNKIKREEFAKQNGFLAVCGKFAKSKSNAGTRSLYEGTIRKIRDYCTASGIDAEAILFEDITRKWLEDFQSFCLNTERQNTVAIHLRNIRTVFNVAIDENITREYPFRKFKIRKEESRDKSYSAAELRKMFSHSCYPGGEQEAVDMFKLMFCLIGINSVDLANLSEPVKGRVEFWRYKTHKFYSIKLQPEALEIIRRYKGSNHLLNILERCPNYKTYFNRLAKTFRKVGLVRVDGKKSTGKAILPDACTGSMRTSWATIAQEELDIPREIIAAALGHHTVDVTSTYLRTNWMKKIDKANRQVLDWVLYKKKK